MVIVSIMEKIDQQYRRKSFKKRLFYNDTVKGARDPKPYIKEKMESKVSAQIMKMVLKIAE